MTLLDALEPGGTLANGLAWVVLDYLDAVVLSICTRRHVDGWEVLSHIEDGVGIVGVEEELVSGEGSHAY